MDVSEVRSKIKEIIANVTNIDPAEIADDAHFIDDLQLDSLSLLEIGVDVDYEFRLGVPEERLQELRTVQDSVDLVMQVKGEPATAAA
ncbi:MAG: phosphopantetheine-binding protein [Thermoanaerobaculia bacterium]|nr:phosphopantetheine-binding protein [Thermoanaerobaculia bacterium]